MSEDSGVKLTDVEWLLREIASNRDDQLDAIDELKIRIRNASIDLETNARSIVEDAVNSAKEKLNEEWKEYNERNKWGLFNLAKQKHSKLSRAILELEKDCGVMSIASNVLASLSALSFVAFSASYLFPYPKALIHVAFGAMTLLSIFNSLISMFLRERVEQVALIHDRVSRDISRIR